MKVFVKKQLCFDNKCRSQFKINSFNFNCVLTMWQYVNRQTISLMVYKMSSTINGKKVELVIDKGLIIQSFLFWLMGVTFFEIEISTFDLSQETTALIFFYFYFIRGRLQLIEDSANYQWYCASNAIINKFQKNKLIFYFYFQILR